MSTETTLVLFLLTLTLAGLGLWEAILHRRHLHAIPIRIHVNGSRGKSSVTRMIAAGLREAGIVTCAKTTGTLPRVILPDGRELPVHRPASANVIEQIRIAALATDHGAQALVVECMALQPFLQWLSEDKLVHATHGVVTNVRPDHLEVMGPDEADVAMALAGMTPHGQCLFTAERKLLPVLASACSDRNCRLEAVTEEEIAGVTEEELDRFSYREHAENVALALRVCADAGVERATALCGMQKMRPDPGAMTVSEVEFFGRHMIFVNGFAANDPVSTRQIWEQMLSLHTDADHRIAVFNCRADRPDRSLQLARACATWTPADHTLLTGSGVFIFARAAVAAGLDPTTITLAESHRADDLFEQLVAMCKTTSLIVGMGNIAGPGLELTRFFQNRASLGGPEKETPWSRS